jgi:hypothetical protein
VLHEERVISEEYINTKQKRLWNTWKFCNTVGKL